MTTTTAREYNDYGELIAQGSPGDHGCATTSDDNSSTILEEVLQTRTCRRVSA